MPENNKRRWYLVAIQDKRSKIIMFVIFFAAIGTVALLLTRAATPATSVEAENGRITGSASVSSSTPNASGNSYVKFGTAVDTCTTFSGPITISAGGTYTGCWQTTDGVTPAITIATTEPVVIKNSTIKGNFTLIGDSRTGADLTVTDSMLLGVTPAASTIVAGRRAVELYRPNNLKVQNNLLENNAGVKVNGWTGASSDTKTIKVLNNQVKNITNKNILKKPGTHTDLMQFVQIGQISSISGVEIAWNEVINKFGESRVEDNINLFKTGGEQNSPITIHNNFIWGGYPASYASAYSGGGILAGDGEDDPLDPSDDFNVGWVNIYDNQVIGTINYGIEIICGHHSTAYRNRVVGSGRISDAATATMFAAANAGLVGSKSSRFANPGCLNFDYATNSMYDNEVGWMTDATKRNDLRLLDVNPATSINNCHIMDLNTCILNPTFEQKNTVITYAMEEAEYSSWQRKLSSTNPKVIVGPR